MTRKSPGNPTPRANHLHGQTSPYLLQHLYNPVDWYPWGDEAHGKARSEDKPVFLSIGYAACHWCHVMERESFENAEIADFLNEHFVSIKVDREERPDIDQIYMNAVQVMTGSGGWPLSAFLTADLQPFFTGTYFPPDDRHGRPGFLSLLHGIRRAWTDQRDDLARSAEAITQQLRRIATAPGGALDDDPIGLDEQRVAAADLARRFDSRWGGFGGAPKFPADGQIALLLREHARTGERVPLDMALHTLNCMARGGLYDHVGGGFARYSVDATWLVPHFEKMLYSQALLVPVYVDAWRLTGSALYRRVVEETLDFVRRELNDSRGGCYSSLDADSEGREGKFYLWTPGEIRAVLEPGDAERFGEVYAISEAGNFEGSNIPNLLDGTPEEQARRRGIASDALLERLADSRGKLLAAREHRARPGTDDKILTAWNGLMISAFARAYQAMGRPEDLRSARGAADFVLSELAEKDRLWVSYRGGKAGLRGYLDDYAFLGRGLLDLYEAGFDVGYLDAAERAARAVLRHFVDAETGGFFFVADDHEQLLTRNRSLHDGALPAGSGVTAELLLRLAVHRNDEVLRAAALRALRAYRPFVTRSPAEFCSLLVAADLAAGPILEVAIVGAPEDPRTRALVDEVHREYRPRLALAVGPARPRESGLPLLDGKEPLDGRPTAFVCRDYACREPVTTPEALAAQLVDSG